MARRARYRLASRLAKRLRQLRHDRDLTQEQAAERCGLATRHYQKLEGAELNVTLATLDRLGHAFNVDPSELIAAAPRIV